jgi:hypothetical protein
MQKQQLAQLIREVILEELRGQLGEEEHDFYKDYRAGNIDYETYQDAVRDFQDREERSFRRAGRGGRAWLKPITKPASAPTPAPAADRQQLLQQVVKYTDADGTQREATVKSLLGYPKEHPGRRVAARMYAQFMAQQKKASPAPAASPTPPPATEMVDGEESLEEKSVPEPYDRSKRERMTKAQIARRQEIGEKLKKSKKQVRKFKKKYGDDWIDYLWATATSIAMGRVGK